MTKHSGLCPWPLRVLLLVLALPLLAPECPMDAQLDEDILRTQDITYGRGYVLNPFIDFPSWDLRALLLDAYQLRDDNTTNKPAVILVHGGGFEGGEKDDMNLVDLAQFLTLQGYVCFSIDYRLTDDEPPAPEGWEDFWAITGLGDQAAAAHAAFVDLKTAIRWVRANSATYSINPNAIAVIGESAGAIAALTVALSDSDEFITDGDDFPIPAGNHPEQSTQIAACGDLWGSAVHLIDEFDDQDPPLLIIHGTNDFTISYVAALQLATQAELADIPTTFHTLFGEGHAPWDAPVGDAGIPEAVLAFLAQHLP